MEAKISRSMVASPIPIKIALFLSFPWSLFVAIPIRIALSPDITMSIKRIFARAIRPAMVQSSPNEWKKSRKNWDMEAWLIEWIFKVQITLRKVSFFRAYLKRGKEEMNHTICYVKLTVPSAEKFILNNTLKNTSKNPFWKKYHWLQLFSEEI